MAPKKKTPAVPPAPQRRQAAKPRKGAVQAPPILAPPVGTAVSGATTAQVTAPAHLALPTAVAGTPSVPPGGRPPPVGTALPAASTLKTPEAEPRLRRVHGGRRGSGQTKAGKAGAAPEQTPRPVGDEVTVGAGPVDLTIALSPKDRRPGATAATKAPAKLSALDAAALVLAETGQPMSCQELIQTMAEKDYWSSPAGLTPQATLYSAIAREIATKGDRSRFRKIGRGRFGLRPAAARP